MEAEVMAKLGAFSLSQTKKTGVALVAEDVNIGLEEGHRSLIGRVYGDKKANALGVKSSLLKLWQPRGLSRVVPLQHNIFQFIFNKESDREGIMRGRPWFFDNQFLVLQPWSEQLNGEEPNFHFSPIWGQVWQAPMHWISVETGRKIGNLLGKTLNVLISENGGREGRHLKLFVEMDLSKTLARGTMLKLGQREHWICFKYEQLPMFCFYCGCVGHNDRVCKSRMSDLEQITLKKDQFGPCMRATTVKAGDGGSKGSSNYSSRQERLEGHENRTEGPEHDNTGKDIGHKQTSTVTAPRTQLLETQRINGQEP